MNVYTFSVTFVLLLIAVNAKPHNGTKCCFPEQFEADMGIQEGIATKIGHAVIVQGLRRFSFDFTNKRSAFRLNYTVTPPGFYGHQRGVTDYAKKITYIIEEEGKKCFKEPYPFDLKDNCIPDDAMPLGSFYTGYNESMQEQKAFMCSISEKQNNLNITIAVTDKECYPISEGIVGHIDGVDVVMGMSYANMQLGLNDLTIFSLPPSCKNATMMSDPPHELLSHHMKYLL